MLECCAILCLCGEVAEVRAPAPSQMHPTLPLLLECAATSLFLSHCYLSPLSYPHVSLAAEEHDYHLLYSDKGSRVCLVASEPVTSAANDWVGGPGRKRMACVLSFDGSQAYSTQQGLLPVQHTPSAPARQRHSCALLCVPTA